MVIDANGLDANAKNDHESVSTSFVDVASASILQHLNTEDDTMDDTASKVVTASLEYETDVADSDSEVAFSQHQIDSAVDSGVAQAEQEEKEETEQRRCTCTACTCTLIPSPTQQRQQHDSSEEKGAQLDPSDIKFKFIVLFSWRRAIRENILSKVRECTHHHSQPAIATNHNDTKHS